MATLVVIGMGHVGGSVAAAARSRNVFERVHGVESNAANRARAKELGLAHEVSETLPVLPDATLAVVAVPPSATGDVAARALATYPDAVVTDVAGVKAPVLEKVRALAPSHASRFVAGHPMAGTAKSGPDAADATLFDGRTAVVCDEPGTDAGAVAAVERFWAALGATVVRERAAAHDEAIALVSHVPHVLAFALARASKGARGVRFAGPSFESATRVAASDPDLWTELLLANRAPVLEALQKVHVSLKEIESAVATGNGVALRQRLVEARALHGRTPS